MSESVAGIIKVGMKYLLGKRKPGGSIGGKWEFPGGKVKKGESFETSLKREFMEELGIEIIIKDFIAKCEFNSNTHKFILHAYYIELCSKDIKMNEHDEFQWFTLDDIKKMKDQFADSDKLLLNYL